jgi:hypothetical protein
MLWTIALTLSLVTAPTVNVSVEGNGYLEFTQGGHALYTSSAPLAVVNGWLSYPDGAPLLPTLRVPEGTTRVDVDAQGNVFAATKYFRAKVGQISLAVFDGPNDLHALGSFLVSSTVPKLEAPGIGDAGTIHVLKSGELAPAMIVTTPQPVATTQPIDNSNDAFVYNWVHQPELVRDPDPVPIKPMPTGHADIRITGFSDTPHDRFTLGDIALIDAPAELKEALWNAQLEETPQIGKKLTLNRKQILDDLDKLGFDTSDFSIQLPRRASVQRSAQQVSSDQITQVAINAAADVLGQDMPMKAKVHMDGVGVPLGEMTLVAESCTPTSGGASVIVVTKINGERYDSHVVKVSVDKAALQQRSAQR